MAVDADGEQHGIGSAGECALHRTGVERVALDDLDAVP
jgi:hypothetical protein